MTMLESISSRRAWLGAAAALVGMVAVNAPVQAQAPKKSVDVGGLSFKAPESWKSVPTTSQMRRAQLRVEPVQGDDFPADLVVFVFPGGAGSVDANVKRWQSQFKDADGNPPRIQSKSVKGKNVEVTLVETAGHYTPSRFPGLAPEPEREKARLLGAIVLTDRFGYFFKMVGPDKTMASIRPAFEELAGSMEVEDK